MFENGLQDWAPESNDDFDWTLVQAGTETFFIGPSEPTTHPQAGDEL